MTDVFKDLEGRWALILGASSGFGASVAEVLAKAGMNICGVHLDRKGTMGNVEELISKIEGEGREALFFNVNAADPQKRAEVLSALEEKMGKGNQLHVFMHSLAFGALRPYFGPPGETIQTAQLEMTVDVMAHSLVYWSQDLVSRNLIGVGGKIFAMTSAGGERIWPMYGAVSAAKAALESHIRQIAIELGPKGIAANCIRAGVTETPALRKIPGNEKMVDLAREKNPHGRLTTPKDVAEVIVALSLSKTCLLTANVIGVDGGENIVDCTF